MCEYDIKAGFHLVVSHTYAIYKDAARAQPLHIDAATPLPLRRTLRAGTQAPHPSSHAHLRPRPQQRPQKRKRLTPPQRRTRRARNFRSRVKNSTPPPPRLPIRKLRFSEFRNFPAKDEGPRRVTTPKGQRSRVATAGGRSRRPSKRALRFARPSSPSPRVDADPAAQPLAVAHSRSVVAANRGVSRSSPSERQSLRDALPPVRVSPRAPKSCPSRNPEPASGRPRSASKGFLLNSPPPCATVWAPPHPPQVRDFTRGAARPVISRPASVDPAFHLARYAHPADARLASIAPGRTRAAPPSTGLDPPPPP